MQNTRDVLKNTFGFDSFRPHQEDIVGAILSGRDAFAALPTGGGKSLCYQLPSMVLDGLTVVVSPLIALMKDQVRGAHAGGIPAVFLNSALDAESARATYRDIAQRRARLLYVSPERLANSHFLETVKQWDVQFIAIDEAHCISEWGHEFRPDYRALTSLREVFPGVPIAAFTATATHSVQQDVINLLKLSQPLVIRGDFDRPEIFYRVRPKERVHEQILDFVRTHPDEPGIVYHATRKSAEDTADYLRTFGITALPYHAGLASAEREHAQEQFVQDKTQVIAATIAFGMGIDKSNVRWIIHGDLPRSLEAYYQETGRAGRDGEPAEALLLYSPRDIAKIRYHIDRMQTAREQERAERNLQEILRYVNAGVCRRTQLLVHFDQEHEGNCDGCDVCAGETSRIDRTVPAQKLMSAALRTGERFGAGHLADIVNGATTDRVLQFGHHRLPTFGVGSDRAKTWWIELARDLEAAGLLRRRDGSRSGLALSPGGRQVLTGKRSFCVVGDSGAGEIGSGGVEDRGDGAGTNRHGIGSSRTSKSKTSDESPSPALRPGQEKLFAALRSVRLQLAREQHVPPYVVFSDKTLRAMARNTPENEKAFLRIHGVGDRKAERYGPVFLRAIREFLDSHE